MSRRSVGGFIIVSALSAALLHSVSKTHNRCDSKGQSKERKRQAHNEISPISMLVPPPQQSVTGIQTELKTNGEAQQGKDTPSERSVADSTRKIANLTAALVFVGIIAAGVSAAQWWEIHSGSDDTHKLAQAAVDQAAAASSNAKKAQNAYTSGQRAWVGTTNASLIQGVVGASVTGNIVYINSGKEPAKLEITQSVISYDADAWENGIAVSSIVQNQNACVSKTIINGNRFAWPTTGFNSYNQHFPLGRPPQAGIVVWTNEIMSGSVIATVQGCITYETLSVVHRTSFCYYYRAREIEFANLGICSFGNYAD